MQDLLIIGASTTGAYLGREAARKGFSVHIIDKLPRKKIGTKYDIFHIAEKDCAKHALPRPVRGDPAWAFEFGAGYTADPYDKFRLLSSEDVIIGLHMHEYTNLMCREAEEAGAKITFGAEFTGFLYDNGTVSGVKYKTKRGEKSENATLVADCSGIPAVGRTALPWSSGVDADPLTGADMFYVVLRYVRLKNEADYINTSCGWPFYKTWIAPCADEHGAILGIGATEGFDHCDRVWAEFEKNVPLPEYELDHIERGATPYTVPPYSLVGDGFIACGDAACLTKPDCGEGVTSSMVHVDAAMPVIERALKHGAASRRDLWGINREYNRVQGADFAATRAMLTVIVNAVSISDFYNAFGTGVVSAEILSESGMTFPTLAKAAGRLAGGIAAGKFSRATLAAAARALTLSNEIKNHYLNFPADPSGFAKWSERADELWQKVGKMC